MKQFTICLLAGLTLAACSSSSSSSETAPPEGSPPRSTEVTLAGKRVTINYSAPSVRGRQIFGPGGLLRRDPTYAAWRAGANEATALHTDTDLEIGYLKVPKGDYTLFVWVQDPDHWQLIVNKQTGQSGLEYNPMMDLGRIQMIMSKPPEPVETYKMTLSENGPNAATLRLEWEKHIATVEIFSRGSPQGGDDARGLRAISHLARVSP